MNDEYLYIIFLDEDWDVEPFGFTRKMLLLALANHLKEKGKKVLCLNRPVSIVTFLAFPKIAYEWFTGKRKLKKIAENLCLYTPGMFLHERLAPYVPGMVRANRWILKRQILRILKRLDLKSKKRLSWIFHPYQKDLLGIVEEEKSIYECYDDYASAPGLSDRERNRISYLENFILKRVDLVFTTSRRLYEVRKLKNCKAFYVPNGVNYEFFQREKIKEHVIDLENIPRPRIGYVGMINQRINFGLIAKIAKSKPFWSLVLIGPIINNKNVSENIKRLSIYKNIYFFGMKEYKLIPRYINGIDVAIIPFVKADYLTSVYPLKINEYLAVGKPVVLTNFSDLSDFGNNVTIAETAKQFISGVKKGLFDDNPEQIISRKRMAHENSWENRASIIHKTICENINE